MTDNIAPTSIRVMVIDDQAERALMVEQRLHANGFSVVARLNSASGLLNQIELHQPQVIVIDLESPDRDVLESLAIVSSHNPTPIVMFTREDDPDFVAEAVQAGVTAYQGQGLNPEIVKTVIDVAMSQFRSFNMLRQQLLETRTELEESRIIEQAKALLSKHQGLDSAAAYDMLRKLSMNTNKRMAQVAETVVATLRNPDHNHE